jgi:hypothetical protein
MIRRMAGHFSFGSLLLLMVPLLSACIVGSHPAGIASSSAPVYPNYTVLGPAEDSSCFYRIFILPVGGKDATEQIIAKLVKEKGGDALAGVTVELRSRTFVLPLVSSECTIVRGMVVKNVR